LPNLTYFSMKSEEVDGLEELFAEIEQMAIDYY
jgi:hypothetical protein